jgi:hypothetical protein
MPQLETHPRKGIAIFEEEGRLAKVSVKKWDKKSLGVVFSHRKTEAKSREGTGQEVKARHWQSEERATVPHCPFTGLANTMWDTLLLTLYYYYFF